MLKDVRRLKTGLPNAWPESYSVRFDSQRDFLGSLNSARRPREHPSTIEKWLQGQLEEHGVETALPCAQRLHFHNQALGLLADQVQHYRPLLLRVIDEVAAALTQMSKASEENSSLRSAYRKLRADSESLARESQYDYISREAQLKMMEASWQAEMASVQKISGLRAENQKIRRDCQTIDKRGRLAVHRMARQKCRLEEELAGVHRKHETALADVHRKHETCSLRLEDTKKRLADTQSDVLERARKNDSLNQKNMSLSARIQELELDIQDRIDKLKEHKRKEKEMEAKLEQSRKELEHLRLLEDQNNELNPDNIDLKTPEAISAAKAEGASESVRLMQKDCPHLCTIGIRDWFEVFRFITEENRDWYTKIKDRQNSGKAVQAVTLYDVDTYFVRPWTRKTGCGISLLMSRKITADAKMMLSHSWAEDTEELKEAVQDHVRKKNIPDDARVWFCLFSLYQPGEEEGDGGPKIADQLESDPFSKVVCSPSLQREAHGYGMNVVHTSQADLYQRLWCVYELHCALLTDDLEVTKSMSQKYVDNTAEKLHEWFKCGRKRSGSESPSQRRAQFIEKKQPNKTKDDLLEAEWETFLWIAGVKVKSATASCSSTADWQKIISGIQSVYGGFDEIDQKIEAFRREQLEGDLKIMFKAIEVDPMFYKFASDRLKRDEKLANRAVEGNGEVLQHVPHDADEYRNMVLVAVRQDGEFLQFASEELRGDKEVVWYAVQNSPKAIKFVGEDLFKDVVPLAEESARGRSNSFLDELTDVIAKRQTQMLQSVEARSEWQDEDPVAQELATKGKWQEALQHVTQQVRQHKALAKASETMMQQAEVHSQITKKTLKFVGQAIFIALSTSETMMETRVYAKFVKDTLQDTERIWSDFTPEEKRDCATMLCDHRFGLDQKVLSSIFPRDLMLARVIDKFKGSKASRT